MGLLFGNGGFYLEECLTFLSKLTAHRYNRISKSSMHGGMVARPVGRMLGTIPLQSLALLRLTTWGLTWDLLTFGEPNP